MPTAKCGGCAKFLSPIEAAKCRQCNAFYHRACVGLPSKSIIAPAWRCPECIKNLVRDNKTETPVRGRLVPAQEEEHSSPEELMNMDSPLNSTALDTTVNFSPDLADELRLFKEELRAEFRLMHQEFQGLRTEMAQLKDSLKTSDERMDSIEARVGALELKLQQKVQPDMDPLENTIAELKCQLNERDQELLLNDIEVTGIPESKDESALHLVKVLATKLGVVIDERDVVHAERVGSTRRNRVETSDGDISADPAAQRPRCISVRFARRATRDALLRAARVRRGLSAGDLDITGPPHRVYVNERLTRTNRQLFYHARQAGSQNKWKYVWTKEGRILARREDLQKAERIRCEDDICRIFGYAKMWYKGVSFTAEQCALVYLVDAAGTRTTTDTFLDMSQDFTLNVFYNESRHGPSYVNEALSLLQAAQYWLTDDGIDNWIINNVRVSQTADGLVRIHRCSHKYQLRTSPSNGSASITSPFLHCTASLGQTQHLFVRRGERRMHFDGNSFIVRNAGHSAGFDDKNQLKVY